MFGMYDMFWSFVDFYMCVCADICRRIQKSQFQQMKNDQLDYEE